MIDYATAVNLYEEAIGGGGQGGFLAVADRLENSLADGGIDRPGRDRVGALVMHLRTLGALDLPDISIIDRYFYELKHYSGDSLDPVVASVRSIVAFCSFYSSSDPARIAEALDLFRKRPGCDIPSLNVACLINEIRAHMLALRHHISGYSADRVAALSAVLGKGVLSPRLGSVFASTLTDFYLLLSARFADVRFVYQGASLVEQIARSATAKTAQDAWLSCSVRLFAAGLEYDAAFPVPGDLIRFAQRRVREDRSAGAAPDTHVCEMAYALGLRARFDWERSGKRSGVSRALSYMRAAAKCPSYATPLATTLRVAYEAGLGDGYLRQSLDVFQQSRRVPGFRASPNDDTNYASTLMLIGDVESRIDYLAQAMDLYEGAIATDGASGLNVPRYINLAVAALSIARICGGINPLLDADNNSRLHRALDATIMADIIDGPKSTHATVRQLTAERIFDLFRRQMRDGADAYFLNRAIVLLKEKEEFWPLGVVRFFSQRIIKICKAESPDYDILRMGAKALGRAKFLLQVLDLCDRSDEQVAQIDGLFSAAVALVQVFHAAGREAEGLMILDRLTAGFVRNVAGEVHPAIDGNVMAVLRRALVGTALLPEEVALIRRSSIGEYLQAEVPSPTVSSDFDAVRLDMLHAAGRILALLRSRDRLEGKLFEAVEDVSLLEAPELISGLADFTLQLPGDVWVSFRNFPPVTSHKIFYELRRNIGMRDQSRAMYRHGARSLGGMPAQPMWRTDDKPPRFLVVHSPRNAAPPLHYGFQFAQKLRETGANIKELALGDCRRDLIEREMKGADVVIIISHGEFAQDGKADRILLAEEECIDAEWLLKPSVAFEDKIVLFISCNSSHFNVRPIHDDVSFAPLCLAMGARAVFSTLRTVTELVILLFVSVAIGYWCRGDGLCDAFENARREMVHYDESRWKEAHISFVGGGMIARLAYKSALGNRASWVPGPDCVDVDMGWSLVIG